MLVLERLSRFRFDGFELRKSDFRLFSRNYCGSEFATLLWLVGSGSGFEIRFCFGSFPFIVFIRWTFVIVWERLSHFRFDVFDIRSPCFFFQAEDGIRDCLLSRGLGDVYKRQEIVAPTQTSTWKHNKSKRELSKLESKLGEISLSL